METAQPPLIEPTTPDQQAAVEHSPGETHTPDRLFKLSTYVHVGDGAEECAEKESGKCDNPQHFHAWCRLPNQFQHETIREKAMAAKARKMRILRDPKSDAHTILEFALEELRATDDRGALVDEILAKDRMKSHQNALADVKEDETFAHIVEDRERLRVLEATPEDQRPADEFQHLVQHFAAFDTAVREKREELETPHREGLEARETNDLIDMIRADRIEREGAREFMDVFSRWEWYLGTMKVTPGKGGFPNERYFSDITNLETAADEVINALDERFGELEAELAAKGKAS